MALYQDAVVMERVLACDGYSLLEKLLPALDALLKRHDLAPEDVASFEVISDLPDGYSARRITETIASVYTFANQNQSEEYKKTPQ